MITLRSRDAMAYRPKGSDGIGGDEASGQCLKEELCLKIIETVLEVRVLTSILQRRDGVTVCGWLAVMPLAVRGRVVA
ncbi:hypothetical protein [Streptomyces sp. NPDC058398]|uniref:hypothetical protein n=1 Tax=Streptomyces sp. NPDC058398 TaxID=3346479 RepID=UPI0036471683